MKQLTIVFIIIAILGLGGAGYFLYQNQGLVRENAELKDEKVSVEKELAVLKSTDLAKENERLLSKLKLTGDTLFAEKESHLETKSKLKTSEAKINTLETTVKKARPYLGVLAAFNDWQFSPSGLPLADRDTRSIDNAISALGDGEVSNLWREVKAGFPTAKQTGNFRFEEVIVLVTSKLTNLIR